jgi:predicted Fe-Mo cluster-binding NifX family protein
MKIAIPQWERRISPMLDVAGSVLVAGVTDGRVTSRSEVGVTQSDAQELVKMLRQLGVDVVICGAVSRELEMGLHAAGIELSAHICGPVEEVLTAYIENRLEGNAFRMPGCCGRRRHDRDRRHCRRRSGGSVE